MGTTPNPKQSKQHADGGKVITNLDRARKLKLLLEANPGLAAAQIEVGAGEYIVRQGDFDPDGLPYAYLVFDGEVEERQSHFYPGVGHKELTVFRVPESGIAFSQALYPVYAKMPAITSVVAVSDALVFMLRNENLVDLYERDPELFQLIKVEYQVRMQVLSSMNEMAKLYEFNHRATELVDVASPFLRKHGWNIDMLLKVVLQHTEIINEVTLREEKRVQVALAHAADANKKSADAFMELEEERERMGYRWRGAEMYLDRLRHTAEFAMGVIERLGVNPDELGIGRTRLDMTPEEKQLLHGESLEELRAAKRALPLPTKPVFESLREEDVDGALSRAISASSTRLLRQSLPPVKPSVRVGSGPPPEEDVQDDADDPGRSTQVYDVLPPSVGTSNVPPPSVAAQPQGTPIARIQLNAMEIPPGRTAARVDEDAGVLMNAPFESEPPTAVKKPIPRLELDLAALDSEPATRRVPVQPPEPFMLEETPTATSRQGHICPSPTWPGVYRRNGGDPGTTTASMDIVVLPSSDTKQR